MPGVSEAALAAHCRRVAGWATEAAHALECSREELNALKRAALSHHDPVCRFRPAMLAEFASDLKIDIPDSAPALAILEAFHGRSAGDAQVEKLARVLEWADQFDQDFELAALDPLSGEIAPELRIVDAAAVLRASHMLPVFPTIAQKAMRSLAAENIGLEQVERIVSGDQVLAVELLKAANAAESGRRQPLGTIRGAIAHIGAGAAIRVICAACLRPVFASRNLHDLWNHSLEAAEVAEELALASKCIEPSEAFLAGLIHDIGRLPFSMLSCDYQARCQRLLQHGCPTLLVELALTGTCHTDVGGDLLRTWALPSRLVDAVKSHHDPVESAGPLAALLYVTEFRTMSDEDLPSSMKLERALKMLNIPREMVIGVWSRESRSLGHLKLAAAS